MHTNCTIATFTEQYIFVVLWSNYTLLWSQLHSMDSIWIPILGTVQ